MIFEKRENEKIILIIRRHWFCVTGLLAVVFIMAILPIFFYAIFSDYLHLKEGYYNIFVLGVSIYYMFITTLFFIGWLDYYLDVAIVTDQRVIDIDQDGLFNRTVSEVHLTKIQDATGSVQGIVGTLMNFGNVSIQTAASQREFILDHVSNPYKIAKTVISLHQTFLENLGRNNSTDI